jgi:N-acetyl-gamma-glutamyl-phosphate reductase
MKNKIKTAIIGATGYVGQELFRLLNAHPQTEISFATSVSYSGKEFSDVYSNFGATTNIKCSDINLDVVADDVDVIFLALPHGLASKMSLRYPEKSK